MALPADLIILDREPETPIIERLEFLTDVMEHKDGTEQRVALRPCPRQSFDLLLRLEDGFERTDLDNRLFDAQDEQWGLPIWHEAVVTTSPTLPTDTTVFVQHTGVSDHRVGGYYIIWESREKYEVGTITAIRDQSIDVTPAIANTYSTGARVMPLRVAIMKTAAGELTYPQNLSEIAVTAHVKDNVKLVAEGFSPLYQGRVVVDGPNALESVGSSGQLFRMLTQDDALTGVFGVRSLWDRNRRSSAKGFTVNSRARLWSVRQLLHHLNGRQVSFYLPTFRKELELVASIVLGDTTLRVKKTGYTTYVRHRDYKRDIRIILNNGNILVRRITGSVIDTGNDLLTIDSSIDTNIAMSDVARIEYLEHVRMDTDTITISHADAIGTARIGLVVKTLTDDDPPTVFPPPPPPPPPPDETGACCKAGVCSVMTEAACALAGGTYVGDNTTCIPGRCSSPPPPPPPPHAGGGGITPIDGCDFGSCCLSTDHPILCVNYVTSDECGAMALAYTLAHGVFANSVWFPCTLCANSTCGLGPGVVGATLAGDLMGGLL